MAKKQSQRRTPSGATGGPGLGVGFEYQVNFAVLKALERISEGLINPLDCSEIAMEPRIFDGTRVTAWDVRVSPPQEYTEAKARPKKEEVFEWLDRVEDGMKQGGERRFELLYGRGSGRLLALIERLCRIAFEANEDESVFRQILEAEKAAEMSTVLDRIPSNPLRTLLHMRVVPFEPCRLEADIQLRLRLLVRETDRQPLYEFLYSAFAHGITRRVTFTVRRLIEEAEGRGITFFPPVTFEPQSLPRAVTGAIVKSCG